jgi:hypothetical protein
VGGSAFPSAVSSLPAWAKPQLGQPRCIFRLGGPCSISEHRVRVAGPRREPVFRYDPDRGDLDADGILRGGGLAHVRRWLRHHRQHSAGIQPDALKSFLRNPSCIDTHLRIPATRFARALQLVSPRERRAQGMPGACCTRGLACNKCEELRTRAYRYSRSIPAFPAQWFYGLCRALPGDEFLLPPSSAN